jgi:hypothetical protein
MQPKPKRELMQPYEAFQHLRELGYREDPSAGTGGLACWVLDENHRTFLPRYKPVPAALIRLARKHALEKSIEGIAVLGSDRTE